MTMTLAGAQRIIELLLKYGNARFGDEWWPGNARNWMGEEGRELEYLLDPGSAALADRDAGIAADLPISRNVYREPVVPGYKGDPADATADAMAALHDRILARCDPRDRELAEKMLADLLDLAAGALSNEGRDEVICRVLGLSGPRDPAAPGRYYLILDQLAASPGATVNEIGAATGSTRSRVLLVLRYGLRKGTVRRSRDSDRHPWRWYRISG